MKSYSTIVLVFLFLASTSGFAQVDENQTGAWYSWFYNRNIENSNWATQMIVQQRYWNSGSDLQQRLVLGQASFKPDNHPIRYGVGYYHLRHEDFGASNAHRSDQALFQQGIMSTLWGERNYLTLRLRVEQLWRQQRDDFQRLRSYISLNRPLNQPTFSKGALYLSLYDEYFINLNQSNFELNRVYAGLGYKLTDHTSWQVGMMRQKTRHLGKNQLMINLFHHY